MRRYLIGVFIGCTLLMIGCQTSIRFGLGESADPPEVTISGSMTTAELLEILSSDAVDDAIDEILSKSDSTTLIDPLNDSE